MECGTLVLVPGLTCDIRLWEHQHFALSQHIDVIIADTFRDDTIEAMADRILCSVDGSFAIAGFSMGGLVTLEVLRKASQRVSHFALLDTNAAAETPKSSKYQQGVIESVEGGNFKEVAESLLGNMIGERAKQDTALVNMLRGMLMEKGAESFIRQLKAVIGRTNHMEALSSYTQPSLVLCGMEDAITPPELHMKMVANLPNADLVMLTDCGHMSPMERPGDVTVALASLLHR